LTPLVVSITFILGSIAVAAQASVGNVAAGCVFAVLQSTVMARYGAAAVNAVVSIAAAGIIGDISLMTVEDSIIGASKKVFKKEDIIKEC
jgi:hypothetical protein